MEKLDDDQIQLVCETVLVLGRISFYVCRDAEDKVNEPVPVNQSLYKECVLPVMENVYALLKREDECNLRESSLGFFYNVADSIGSDFAFLLDKIAEIALTVAESQKGVDYVKEKKGEFSLDTDSEDEEKSGRVVNVKVGYMDEKASAIYALGAFAKACPTAFKPHWPRVLAILDDNYQQFYENIRVQSVNCYMNLALGMVKADNGDRLPQRGNIQLSPSTQEFL